MKEFTAPEIEVVSLECVDIISTSHNLDEGGSED